jgi:aminoglycoside phosphotransferase (APT) family kinase protein
VTASRSLSRCPVVRTGPPPAPPRPELTAEGIAAVTAGAAREAGLSTVGAHLVKFTNNAVVLLPRAGVVLRIAGSAEVRSRVPAVVATARWMAALGLPAVRLLPGVPQPLEVTGHLVTVWRAAQPPQRPQPADATIEHLAAVLRELHAVDAPLPDEVGPWDPAEALRRRLAEAEHLPAEDASFLAAELEAVEAGLAGLAGVRPLLPPGLVHGDAYAGNLVASSSGGVLCDFDGVAVGPREWDLVPVAVGALRFGYARDLQQRFAHAYGVDVTRWDGFPVLRRLRELQLVASVVPVLRANPAVCPQWRLRLESLRRGDTTGRWSPYPWG